MRSKAPQELLYRMIQQRRQSICGVSLSTDGLPSLRPSVLAWTKLACIRDMYDEEIAAYGISDPDDLLIIRDVWIPRQTVSYASFELDADDIALSMDRFYTESKLEPVHVARIWIHTHPYGVLHPSETDRSTARDLFGSCAWSVMVILPKGGPPYAELSYGGRGQPKSSVEIPVQLGYVEPLPTPDCLERLKQDVAERVRTRSVRRTPVLEYTWRNLK